MMGLKIIACLSVISLIGGVLAGILTILTFNIVSLFMLIVALPQIYGGYLSLKWLMADNSDTRKGFIFAQIITVVSCLC